MQVRFPPPPPQKGYLSDTCAIPSENKANGCETPLSDTISKVYCAIWGGISHWAAKLVSDSVKRHLRGRHLSVLNLKFDFISDGGCTREEQIALSLKRHLFPHGGREPKAFWICFSRVHPPSEIKSNFKFKTLKRHFWAGSSDIFYFPSFSKGGGWGSQRGGGNIPLKSEEKVGRKGGGGEEG